MLDSRQPGQLLDAIFSASPDAVVVIDDSSRIVLSSPAVTSLFGYSPEELVGELIEVLIPIEHRRRHGDHVSRFFDAPRARVMAAGLELTGRHRDGSEVAVDVSLSPVEVDGRRYSAAFVRDARERQREIDRLRAVNEITRRLLGGSGVRVILPLVAERARRLTRSDAVWIVTPAASGELEVVSVDGPGTEVLLGVTLSAETSRSAEAIRSGSSEVIGDLSATPNVPSEVIDLELGPGLYVPLVVEGRGLGTLVLGRVRGAPGFEPHDVAFAEAFAGATAAALELGEVRSELDRLGIVAEDERIARDLHDTVIQQLFAIGLSLQASRGTASGLTGDRIDAAIGDLDGVIRDIRTTIFRLPGRTQSVSGLRDEMLRLGDKFGEELAGVARIAFHGPVDTLVPDVVAEELLQVMNEALSNVVRHARASSVEAVVVVEDGWLSLSLVDDGVGIADEPSAGHGLRNMSDRAIKLGGTCAVSRRERGGTLLEWRVPI